MSECMNTCPKYDGARFPKTRTLKDKNDLIKDLFSLATIPGTKKVYPHVLSGATWMPISDVSRRGIWKDYYTGEEAKQELVEPVIDGINSDDLNCGVIREVVTMTSKILDCSESWIISLVFILKKFCIDHFLSSVIVGQLG